MNKNDLKKVLKPLIKECIKEVIFEDGTLSGIITEKKVIRSNQPSEALVQAKRDLEETKRSLQESTGLSGIFEGTTPMRSGGGSSGSKHGALRDHDPGDPGVDISGIMSIAGNAWKQLK